MQLSRCSASSGEPNQKRLALSGQKPLFDAVSAAILENLASKILPDGTNSEGIIDLYRRLSIQGLGTSPTLMGRVGVSDNEILTRSVLESVIDKPTSFEVFSGAQELPTPASTRFLP